MAEEKKEISEKFKSIISEIEKMSVLDLNELVTILENKFNVQANAPMINSIANSNVITENKVAPAEEKKFFTIILKAVGDKKIQVIKAVRTITGLGLKESKDIVDEAASIPQKIKENIGKDDADEAKKQLEEAGATVELE